MTAPPSMYRPLAILTLLLAAPLSAQGPAEGGGCHAWSPEELVENPSAAELRCRWRINGPGRFGLLSYADVPVYQTTTPMPGTHLVGVRGHAGPRPGETFEGWEWRVLRTEYGPAARTALTSLEVLDPFVASTVMRFEAALAEAGVDATRRETWRSPDRQAYLFQQGRSRPGPLATTTLTSWHSQRDASGNPAGRAIDYHVPWSQMSRFHAIARASGLVTFGADSNDPGHVYVPDPEPVDEMEVVMLRVIPRVPEVTLATGLPVDRHLPRGGRRALFDAAVAFARSAYIPGLTPRVAGSGLRRSVIRSFASGSGGRALGRQAGDDLAPVMLEVDGREP